MKPLISVIIPTHNSASVIEVALDSIRKQTYTNLEIIVIDDNSTDNTAEIVKKYAQKWGRVAYYKLPEDDPERFDHVLNRNINAGYMARNFGFTKVSGELITFQDADDASLLNRIEIQYDLLTKYNAAHLCVDWMPYDTRLIDTAIDMSRYTPIEKYMVSPREIYSLSQKTKGIVAKLSTYLNARIPFHYKRLRIINKLFFGALNPYPGTGNSPLFKREVIEKVRFRRLRDRIWPSFMGRGADRDFNFQVAETFKNNYTFHIPLYMWSREMAKQPQGLSATKTPLC